jgi:hypothetical protein
MIHSLHILSEKSPILLLKFFLILRAFFAILCWFDKKAHYSEIRAEELIHSRRRANHFVTKREENSAEARRTNFFVILLYTTNREIFASPFSTSALPQFILLMNLFSTYLFPFRHSSTSNNICSHYKPKQAFKCSSGYKSALSSTWWKNNHKQRKEIHGQIWGASL